MLTRFKWSLHKSGWSLVLCMLSVALLCSSCWTDLATKDYPSDLTVVDDVEEWRDTVEDALLRHGADLDTHLDIALVVMACESKADPDVAGGGLYQFTRELWTYTAQAENSRYDPYANIEAMAEIVSNGGWRHWAGGKLSNGTVWGSGPYGHRCWEYP